MLAMAHNHKYKFSGHGDMIEERWALSSTGREQELQSKRNLSTMELPQATDSREHQMNETLNTHQRQKNSKGNTEFSATARQAYLILDEADTLLDMGFHDDIEAGKEHLPHCPQRQTFLFFHGLPCDPTDYTFHPGQEACILPHYPSEPRAQITHLARLIVHNQLIHPHTSNIIDILPTTKMTQLFASLLRETPRRVLPSSRHTRIYELHSKDQMTQRTLRSEMFRNDDSSASILNTSHVP
ncbi:hypothetical protein BDQ12DRAFT_727567 [Crucibulum laeve]|uniref:Helicase ATP-binding domain-containing protein n=1 Tax=Crucibulum laeve TaxID=68775 RepID=A0A5C3LKJ0_9AGAR|nr:hypothetical protein BDQ12DRAFT_727567 [Crucibulum laeve]